MGKQLLREYYQLCEDGVCQDLLTESDKRFIAEGGMVLTGTMQMCGVKNVSCHINILQFYLKEPRRHVGLSGAIF